MYTERLSERIAPLVVEPADSFDAAIYDSVWVAMGTYHRAWLVANVGDMAQGATFDIQIRQAQDAAGTGAATIADKAGTGTKAITQLTQAGGDGDDLVGIELQTEELNVNGGFDFIGVRMVIANAAVEVGYVLYGESPRFAAVPVTAWTEIID